MILPCIEVKRFEISMLSCTWLFYCNRQLQCYGPTQFSGAEVGS